MSISEQNSDFGRLESVHPISPVYLQRALVLIILSFIFFIAMLIAFSIRQQIGYFVLATAFLVVKLFTLFGWMMQRKKVVRLYANGFTFGKESCRYDEIENTRLNRNDQKKQSGEIIKLDGKKIILPETIYDLQGIVEKIDAKLKVNN